MIFQLYSDAICRYHIFSKYITVIVHGRDCSYLWIAAHCAKILPLCDGHLPTYSAVYMYMRLMTFIIMVTNVIFNSCYLHNTSIIVSQYIYNCISIYFAQFIYNCIYIYTTLLGTTYYNLLWKYYSQNSSLRMCSTSERIFWRSFRVSYGSQPLRSEITFGPYSTGTGYKYDNNYVCVIYIAYARYEVRGTRTVN